MLCVVRWLEGVIGNFSNLSPQPSRHQLPNPHSSIQIHINLRSLLRLASNPFQRDDQLLIVIRRPPADLDRLRNRGQPSKLLYIKFPRASRCIEQPFDKLIARARFGKDEGVFEEVIRRSRYID